ncbi:MAG: hypothetical protein ABI787_01160 [Spartobacteria bacterium]
MLHQHLPYLIPRLVTFGRHAVNLCYQMLHPVELGLYRLRVLVDRKSNLEDRPTRPVYRRLGGRRLPLLIHYHIFKNAGTSFEWALQRVFGDDYRAFDSSTPGGSISRRDIIKLLFRHPHLLAVSSHQAAPPAPRIRGRQVLTSILIRDPIARIRSIYAFERAQDASTPGALKAKELSFKDYVEWRLKTAPAMLCNYQVHFCTRSPKGSARPPDRARLEAAIANLDVIDIVGTVARYNEWITLAENILATAFPGTTLLSARRNTTAQASLPEVEIFEQLVTELGEETARYLVENNQLDMCLYQVADALLTRRLAERGVRLQLLQAYTAAQKI